MRKKNPSETTWENPGKPLRRSPIGSIRGLTMADLGDLLEVETDGRVYRWKRGSCPLLWCSEKRALIAVHGGKRGKKSKVQHRRGRAASTYERWSASPARTQYQIAIPPEDRGVWVACGTARRTDYHSPKWGRSESYTHDHGPGVRLYRYGGSRPPWIWVLRGGSLRITARGIEG